MKVGFIGLGKMGGRMAAKLLDGGHEVVAWNRSLEASNELKKIHSNLVIAEDIENLIMGLEKPRVIWIMVSHGAVDEVLEEVKKYAESGDVVIDGGNSNYKDTDKRYDEFSNLGINYLGVGTSGGILAEKNGFPFMVGGHKKAYDFLAPVLDTLSKPNGGHEYFGEGGAGHFVKMVHNGIEYGQMQSLSEGFEVLEKSKYNLDLNNVAGLFQKGTLVSGFLLDRLKDVVSKNDYKSLGGEVAASGEADWTVETAKELGLDVKIIEESLNYRKRTEKEEKLKNSTTAKLLNALRLEFGGHKIKKS